MTTVSWLASDFTVCSYSGSWNDVGGVYIFTGLDNQNRWVPLYVGQANSFQQRLPNHERWQEAHRLGATHIHAKVVPNATSRAALEQQLIVAFQPFLNTQLK